jgi:hypothetical protein
MHQANLKSGRIWVNFNPDCLGHHHHLGVTNQTKDRMNNAHGQISVTSVRPLRDQLFNFEVTVLVDTVDNGDKWTDRIDEHTLIEEWIHKLREEPKIIETFLIK